MDSRGGGAKTARYHHKQSKEGHVEFSEADAGSAICRQDGRCGQDEDTCYDDGVTI